MTTPTETAEALATKIRNLHPELRKARVWTAEDGHARVYTGFRGEHIRVDLDGTVSRSQSRMTWGHLIRDLVA